MNQTRHLEEGFSNRLQEWLYRWSLGWRFGKRIERAYSRHIKNLVSPSEFLSRTNVHAILNPIPTRLLTTDRSKLVQLYEQGIQKGWENIRRLVDQQPTA
jgi:hypothetical protein